MKNTLFDKVLEPKPIRRCNLFQKKKYEPTLYKTRKNSFSAC